MSDTNDENKQNIHAEDNSVAVGNISVGGNVGDIHIGNVYKDIPFSRWRDHRGRARRAIAAASGLQNNKA